MSLHTINFFLFSRFYKKNMFYFFAWKNKIIHAKICHFQKPPFSFYLCIQNYFDWVACRCILSTFFYFHVFTKKTCSTFHFFHFHPTRVLIYPRFHFIYAFKIILIELHGVAYYQLFFIFTFLQKKHVLFFYTFYTFLLFYFFTFLLLKKTPFSFYLCIQNYFDWVAWSCILSTFFYFHVFTKKTCSTF